MAIKSGIVVSLLSQSRTSCGPAPLQASCAARQSQVAVVLWNRWSENRGTAVQHMIKDHVTPCP